MTRRREIEMIVDEAADIVRRAEEEGADARLLEDNWINAFLQYGQNVCHETFRHIWAKILASLATDGAQPVSKATLENIRLIEPDQACMFERAFRRYFGTRRFMDVDPIDCFDVGYYSQILQATASEDLTLLKRMRDLQPHVGHSNNLERLLSAAV